MLCLTLASFNRQREILCNFSFTRINAPIYFALARTHCLSEAVQAVDWEEALVQVPAALLHETTLLVCDCIESVVIKQT
jgi:hypothetical protein